MRMDFIGSSGATPQDWPQSKQHSNFAGKNMWLRINQMRSSGERLRLSGDDNALCNLLSIESMLSKKKANKPKRKMKKETQTCSSINNACACCHVFNLTKGYLLRRWCSTDEWQRGERNATLYSKQGLTAEKEDTSRTTQTRRFGLHSVVPILTLSRRGNVKNEVHRLEKDVIIRYTWEYLLPLQETNAQQ